MPNADNHFYEFGPFRVDAGKRRLLRDGEPLALTPKAFDTLLVLVENRGRVIEKDELMQEIWGETIVEEGGLARNISVLRRTLGETPDEHQYIVTVPGRGYRFVASVREFPNGDGDLIVAQHTKARVVIEEEEEGETGRRGEWGKRGKGEEGEGVRRLTGFRRRSNFYVIGAVLVVPVVAVAWFGVAWRSERAVKSLAVKSIAVLPFKPLVAESRDEYLQMGMADVLITRLSNLRQLTVRPTSAVRKYTDPAQDALAAGQELKVEAVIDGNLQRAGDRIRVTARLVSVSDGATLWAETFDEKFTDLFNVEDRLAGKLAGALAPRLSGEEKSRFARRGTENPEAFQAYLKGRYFWSRWSAEGLGKAIEYFEQARAIDPNYALAYSGLADAYNLLGYRGYTPPREAFPKSEAAALKALQLDDQLGEAHLSLAKTRLFYDWDWPGFERELRRALDLSPNNADVHGMQATYLLVMGRFDESIAERRRALDLDPLSPLFTTTVGWSYFYARRYDEAIEWYQKALELDPNFAQAHNDIGLARYQQGRYDEAIAELLKARALSGGKPEEIEALRQAYAKAGTRGYLQKDLELAEEQLKQGPVRPWRMAQIYHLLGDKDRTFAWLEKAYAERDGLMPFLKVSPQYENLHADPRFTSLLRRIGLEQ